MTLMDGFLIVVGAGIFQFGYWIGYLDQKESRGQKYKISNKAFGFLVLIYLPLGFFSAFNFHKGVATIYMIIAASSFIIGATVYWTKSVFLK